MCSAVVQRGGGFRVALTGRCMSGRSHQGRGFGSARALPGAHRRRWPPHAPCGRDCAIMRRLIGLFHRNKTNFSGGRWAYLFLAQCTHRLRRRKKMVSHLFKHPLLPAQSPSPPRPISAPALAPPRSLIARLTVRARKPALPAQPQPIPASLAPICAGAGETSR